MVNDGFIYSGRKQIEGRKKIKNSDVIWLTLRHPREDVKKALRSLEPCCPI